MSMRLALALVLCLFTAPRSADVARRVAAVLTRVEAPDAGAIAAGAAEIASLGDVAGVLLDALGTGCVPGDGNDGTRLAPGQRTLLLAAVERLGPATLGRFVAEVARDPASATRVSAALRVLGAAHGTPDARAMLALARAAEERDLAVEEALVEVLQLAFARSAGNLVALSTEWKELGPVSASVAVRALEPLRSDEALACLRSLLGQRPEYDALLLGAIGNSLAGGFSAGAAELLAQELQPYVRSADGSQAQAAVAALGRLGEPDSVPLLLDVAEGASAPMRRAAFGALRRLGGVSLPESVELWRGWYEREQSWWEERAPARIAAVADEGEVAPELSQRFALARELGEHPLYRDELVAALLPWLAHADPAVRILACQALGRLDSPRALAPLCALLEDDERAVAAAAHATLAELTRSSPPVRRAACQEFLRRSGFHVD